MSTNSQAPADRRFLGTDSELSKLSMRLVVFICVIYAALSIIGLLNLYSAAMGEHFFYSQLRAMGISAIAMIFFGWIFPVRWLEDYCYVIYGLLCLSLVAVLLLGHTAHGSQRWLNLGIMSIQPSEIAKIGVLLVVARFFRDHAHAGTYRLRDLRLLGLLVGLPFLLIFKQPDLGTAGVCVLIAVTQTGFVRLDLRSIGIVAISSLVVGILGWFVFLHDYQRTRVLTLLNPDLDPHGSGYNSMQSLIAIGSGNFLGKGFLQGTQTQLQFLPARHTDFIFSVFAEEHGFWAGGLLFATYAAITLCALEVARYSRDTFTALVAIGVGAMTFVHFVINIAMVLGMFPVVGMPLPLFSQGGSSLLATSIAIGILIAVHRTNVNRRRNFRPSINP